MAVLKYIVYGTPGCGYCIQAKRLLLSNEINHEYIDLSEVSAEQQAELQKVAGIQFKTVPQIFKERTDGLAYVGGFTELKEELK